MAKGMSQMGNWVEVAPAPYIKPRRRHSTSPKLETIFEEGYYGEFNDDGSKMSMEVRVPKRVVYFLPVVIAMVTYYFLFSNIAS